MNEKSWERVIIVSCLIMKLSQVLMIVIFLKSRIVISENIVLAMETRVFPANFKFGSASAAYQVEGAWNKGGRLPSVWDTLTHNHSELVVDRSTGDDAANSYDLYEEDVRILKNVGFDFYRFSISWSRVLPTGDLSSLNEEGLAYYDKLINALLAQNIQPVVTMYHWDLPQTLQSELGGMINPLIVDYFSVYADLLFKRFGDRVKHWITFNEPFDFCSDGYGTGTAAPLVKASGIGEYLCVHHVLLSHAAVYKLYGDRYRAEQSGKIGITLNSRYYYLQKPDGGLLKEDPIIERALQYRLGWFAHPIFSKEGGYPPVMVEEIAKSSAAEGRAWSRLPAMSDEQRILIRGSADFFGFNYYTSRIVEKEVPSTDGPPSWQKDLGLKYSINESWPIGKSTWLYSVPEGLGDLMRWIKKEYENPEVWITENGWSDGGELEDNGRIQYSKDHLNELLKAIVDDRCDVQAYTVWSIMDNFEWLQGYSEKFGIYYVDFASDAKTRTPKKSVGFFKALLTSHRIPDTF